MLYLQVVFKEGEYLHALVLNVSLSDQVCCCVTVYVGEKKREVKSVQETHQTKIKCWARASPVLILQAQQIGVENECCSTEPTTLPTTCGWVYPIPFRTWRKSFNNYMLLINATGDTWPVAWRHTIACDKKDNNCSPPSFHTSAKYLKDEQSWYEDCTLVSKTDVFSIQLRIPSIKPELMERAEISPVLQALFLAVLIPECENCLELGKLRPTILSDWPEVKKSLCSALIESWRTPFRQHKLLSDPGTLVLQNCFIAIELL